MYELIALSIVEVQHVGLEGVSTPCLSREGSDLNPNILEQLYEVVDVADVGNIVDGYRLAGQQRGTDDLQGLVLGALWEDGAAQRVSALDDECCNIALLFLIL